jgi:dsDNA-specific endonuclease/ATPase MutS2
LYGYDEQYNKQSNKVADVIQNSHKSTASLKEQREKLIQEVNKLAKLSGPLPKLRLAG